MIPVKVDQIFLSKLGFVVLLKGANDERSLPIFIGAAEAQAIAIVLEGAHVQRPLTHDLLKQVLDCLECRLKKVEVCKLEDSTFYARLILERDGMETEMDCRPSDAIALALRCSAPIYVARQVMDEAGKVIETLNMDQKEQKQKDEQEMPEVTSEAKQTASSQKELSPIEVLRRDLEKAVKDERYEDAAKFRDEIERLKRTHTKN
ncbi:MAG: bifunctional nuclease family protein [Lentisphaerae bacterium]|nr:bifunctional nuclease family protein [Lentisphaerota bacterium]